MESMEQLSVGVVAGLVVVALAFDFMNGFHDAANGISTVVSTRVLKPYQAVVRMEKRASGERIGYSSSASKNP